MWRVALTILNNGVKSSLGACEVQLPGQGGIQILVTVVSPCDHAAYVPAVFVHEPGVLQFINRREQTVFWGWLSCACCCATTGVLVGACTNCGVPQLPLNWERAMLCSTMDTCSASSRVAFGRISTIFHVTGWTRILGSILVVHCTHGR